MPDDEIEDPAANTQMFQAFMDRPREPEPSPSRGLVVALVVLAVLVVAAVVWLLAG
jgi:hypothetical protein